MGSDVFLEELRSAETRFGSGFVGVNYFITKWRSEKLDPSPMVRRRLLNRLAEEGKVELYNAGPMKWVEVATKAEDIRRVLAELSQEDRHDVRQRAARSFCPPPPEQLGLGFG